MVSETEENNIAAMEAQVLDKADEPCIQRYLTETTSGNELGLDIEPAVMSDIGFLLARIEPVKERTLRSSSTTHGQDALLCL
jgi:hypothetical protein